jgi:hypothetical protein
MHFSSMCEFGTVDKGIAEILVIPLGDDAYPNAGKGLGNVW